MLDETFSRILVYNETYFFALLFNLIGVFTGFILLYTQTSTYLQPLKDQHMSVAHSATSVTGFTNRVQY